MDVMGSAEYCEHKILKEELFSVYSRAMKMKKLHQWLLASSI